MGKNGKKSGKKWEKNKKNKKKWKNDTTHMFRQCAYNHQHSLIYLGSDFLNYNFFFSKKV